MPRTNNRHTSLTVFRVVMIMVTTTWLVGVFATTDAGAIEGAQSPKSRPPKIVVPKGYSVSIAAASPLVKHPLMATFDNRGRLYVAENAGKNLGSKDLETERPNFIRRLEDTNGDGQYDKSTIFADKMTFPQGALWHDGALYVASPPNIWRLEDTNDDGVADRREKIVDKFGYSGNAASIHGCFLGPAGRIYWCDGRHGHQFTDEKGRTTSQGKAARIFSCLPDGSDVRVHCGGGMDNPVEIDFTPEGEMLGTVNLFYRQRGDCLVHWMHGAVYPRFDQQHCTDEFKRTGPLLGPVHNLGHVAVSGMTRYRGAGFGAATENNVFVCEFNTHKVSRITLRRSGATFSATRHEFLTSKSGDFHPTDVMQDADGSLLVIDTGGWFRIGCPTSQIAKPNIHGAIYRIRRTDSRPPKDPLGLQINWKNTTPTQLVELLDDDRFAVRRRAMTQLVNHGAGAISSLEKIVRAKNRPQQRGRAVRVLSRIKTPAAMALVRDAIVESDAHVRQIATNCAGINRDRQATERIAKLLTDKEPQIQRTAATALGQIGDPQAIEPLLSALASNTDRTLEHALIYALIEIGEFSRVAKGLDSEDPRVRRAALIAIDQIDPIQLTRKTVARLLDTDDQPLQTVVLEVISRRPEWGGETVTWLRRQLDQDEPDAKQFAALRGIVTNFASEPKVQQIVAAALSKKQLSVETRLVLLESIARARIEKLPEKWNVALTESLDSQQVAVREQAIVTIASLSGNRFHDRLSRLASDEKQPPELRVGALGVVLRKGNRADQRSFDFLLQVYDAKKNRLLRRDVAATLGEASLSEKQLLRLADRVTTTGPLELPLLITAFERGTDQRLGRRLIASLQRSPGLLNLDRARLVKLFDNYPQSVVDASKELLARFDNVSRDRKQKLAKLAGSLEGGNPQRGKAIFLSAKASCSACHRMGDQGGQIGPDLSTIGQSRTPRDLLEAIVLPSASLARGYQTVKILTTEGETYSGVITLQTAREVLLRNANRGEIRIRRDQIEKIVAQSTSIMPQGLDQTITGDELRDLIAYLSSRHTAKK